MSDREDLSRLLEGELPPEAAAALLGRIAEEPALAEDWALLQRLPRTLDRLLASPPPPGLDDLVLARVARPRRVLPWVVLALAAALVLALFRPRSELEVVVPQGTVRVEGRVQLLAGPVAVTIDGITEVTVEPPDRVGRGTEQGGTMDRRLLAVAVLIAVTEGTAVVHAGDAAPVVLTAGESTRIGPAPASAPATAPTTDDARIHELEAQNAVLRRLLEDADVEAHGTPIPWPPGLPEPFTPAGFERQVRRAVAECAPDVEIAGFECSEPPCFALLRAPREKDGEPYGTWWDALINRCPAWTDFYTDTVVGGSGEITCPDGHTERFNAWGGSMDLVTPRADDEQRENAGKRFRIRMEEIQRSWRCAGE